VRCWVNLVAQRTSRTGNSHLPVFFTAVRDRRREHAYAHPHGAGAETPASRSVRRRRRSCARWRRLKVWIVPYRWPRNNAHGWGATIQILKTYETFGSTATRSLSISRNSSSLLDGREPADWQYRIRETRPVLSMKASRAYFRDCGCGGGRHFGMIQHTPRRPHARPSSGGFGRRS
jgi:hypothetical protein